MDKARIAVVDFIAALKLLGSDEERKKAIVKLNSEVCIYCGELTPRHVCYCIRDD